MEYIEFALAVLCMILSFEVGFALNDFLSPVYVFITKRSGTAFKISELAVPLPPNIINEEVIKCNEIPVPKKIVLPY